jgi:hypothetical protein
MVKSKLSKRRTPRRDSETPAGSPSAMMTKPVSENEPDEILFVGAENHARSDLGDPSRDAVCDHAIETDHRHKPRNDRR